MSRKSIVAAMTVAPEREAIAVELADRILQPGSVVIMVGPVGSGKTKVADAALCHAQDRDRSLRVLFVRGVRCRITGSYLGLQEMLAGIDIANLGLPRTQTIVLQTTLGLIPPTPTTGGAAAIPGAMMAVLNALLASGPVAVIVDDVDDVDPESAGVIRYLASRKYVSVRAPSFLLTQTDTGDANPPGTEAFHLPPLSRGGLRAVLRDHTGTVLSARAVDRVVERSEGNPRRALELADHGETAVTGSLDQALRDRIVKADDTARRVLEAVAVAGAASAAQVIDVVGVEPESVSAAVDAELVAERDGSLRAAHPAIGDIALTLLGDQERKKLHARFADVAETLTARADHLDRSVGPGPDPLIAQLLIEAAGHARSLGALTEALDLATRAVQRMGSADPTIVSSRLLVAELAFLCGDYDLTLEALSEVSLNSLENEQLDRVLPFLSEASAASRGFAATRAMLTALFVPTTDSVRQAIFDVYLADWDERPDIAADLAGRSVEQLRAAQTAPISLHRALGLLAVRGVDEGAGLDEDLLEELASLEREGEMPQANVDSLSLSGFYAYQLGDLFTSRSALAAMRAAALERGDELRAGLCALHLASVEIYAGHRSRADHWLREWEAIDPWPDTPSPAAVAAYGLRALLDDDKDGIRRLVSAPHGPGSELTGELVRRSVAGLCDARAGRWESAVSELLAARRMADSMGIREPGRRRRSRAWTRCWRDSTRRVARLPGWCARASVMV